MLVLIAALAGTLVTACGGAPDSPPSMAGRVARTTPPSVPQLIELRVGLTEWEIITGAGTIGSGDATLAVTNAGTTIHDLRVTAAGHEVAATRMLQPGEQQDLMFTAPPDATVQLWCTVPGHRTQGMQATLTVAGSPRS